MMFKVKILVVGPCESGKTVLANFLADATDTSSGEYHPTQGCRILEFETNNFNSRQNIEVELWDVSGDKKFESCWPAIAKDTNGVLFVYDPDQGSHGQDLAKWHDCFVQNQGLKDSQCAVFAHHKPGSSDRERAELSGAFSNLSVVQTNIEEDGESVRDSFNKFLSGLQGIMSTNREQEELSIMNQR
ncbi:intraflagellar transport protein 22 homolog [Mytilus edulis]|uniref:intraflagellar transport protein 22 homolog n=1 Tax=Mytilus edulis TaxID=6550 RepID=UPI0039F0DE4F